MSETKELNERERAELEKRRHEAQKEIRVIGDPVLRERAADVTEFDRGLRKLAKRMVRIMHDAPGIGLAAPQVGVQRRLLVFDVDDDPQALVNPVLSDFSEEVEESDEGCLSVPGLNVPVLRSLRVHVAAQDVYGAEIEFDAEGLAARVIQHEFDHLEGVLIVDRTSRSARAAALRELAERGDARELHVVAGGL